MKHFLICVEVIFLRDPELKVDGFIEKNHK